MTDEEIQQILDDYNICYVVGNLPSSSKAFTFCHGDRYLVVVSEQCSSTQQRLSLVHELKHIIKGHFQGGFEEVEILEKEAKQ
ncbi:ImmA/IrrE family metallo-endopeptidase [Tannockella kyphosi]|uniref:ImmA/IrrE family metallo-endopeptidase n=1 Tax=Tannockella kyphosi TaxID=2899121 RepID=UPI0020124869|nr:ImmA/IrrE family metallo-endopeptidase [Tannockella kyphosi]